MFSGKLEFQLPLGGVTLQTVLEQKLVAMRVGIEQAALRVSGKVSDEEAYVKQMIAFYSIVVPSLDVTPERVRKTDTYKQVHGSELVGSVNFPDRMYQVWEVTFTIPVEGDIALIQYLPHTGAGFGWRPDVAVRQGCVVFQARTLEAESERKLQAIKDEKQRVIDYLQQSIEAIAPELAEFNQAVASQVAPLFERFKEKYQKDKDILAQL